MTETAAHTHPSSAGDAPSPDAAEAISDLLAYANASGEVMRDRANLFSSQVKLSLLQLLAGVVGAIAALVLLFSSWIIAMVGLSQILADWLGDPALSALMVALLNGFVGLLALWFARLMIRRATTFSQATGETA